MQGAFASLVIGLGISIVRMGLTFARSPPKCGSGDEDEQFAVVRDVHYLHFAVILAAITVAIIVPVSLVTEPRPKAKVSGKWFNINNVSICTL